MMRASGAMPSMTALQMATASLAVPKSVIKTMVGRALDAEREAESFGGGVFEQAAPNRASASSEKTSRRTREIINTPLRPRRFPASQCKARPRDSARRALTGTPVVNRASRAILAQLDQAPVMEPIMRSGQALGQTDNQGMKRRGA